MSIHSHLPFDQSTSHARIPAGGINLIASIDSVSEAQVTASFFGSTKSLHGKVATTSAETTTHNHSNQQYSINAVTTSTGTIAERYAYSAYGEPTILDGSGSVIASSSINNRYSYTGREWDATVGLYHFRARWMSPKSGRFMGRDPIGYDGSEWGLYEFVEGSSLTFTDPSGEAAVIPAMGGIVIIAGTALVVSAAVQAYCIANPDQCKIQLPRLPRIRRIPWPWPKPRPNPKPLSPDPPLPPPLPPCPSDEECNLVRSEAPKEGEKCWYCIYICSGGRFPMGIDRYRPGGCPQRLTPVDGWKPGDHPAQGGDGKSLCEGHNDDDPLPVVGYY